MVARGPASVRASSAEYRVPAAIGPVSSSTAPHQYRATSCRSLGAFASERSVALRSVLAAQYRGPDIRRRSNLDHGCGSRQACISRALTPEIAVNQPVESPDILSAGKKPVDVHGECLVAEVSSPGRVLPDPAMPSCPPISPRNDSGESQVQPACRGGRLTSTARAGLPRAGASFGVQQRRTSP